MRADTGGSSGHRLQGHTRLRKLYATLRVLTCLCRKEYVELLKVLRHEKDMRCVVWGDDVGSWWLLG